MANHPAETSEKEERPRVPHALRREWKARALAVASVLPDDYIGRVVQRLPHLDDRRGRMMISQVKTAQIGNLEITVALEAVSADFAQEVLVHASQKGAL